QTIDRRRRILVAPVPSLEQCLVSSIGHALLDLLILRRRNLCGQRPPAVTVAKQHDEVRSWRGLLAAFDLLQTNLDGLLIEARLFAHAPAQINRLKAAAVLLTQLTQLGEDCLL